MNKDKSSYSSYKGMVCGSVSEGEFSFSLETLNFRLVFIQTVADRDNPLEDYHSSLVIVEVMGDEVLISGSQSTWVSSSRVISVSPRGLSEATEIEEDDDDGEEDIVGLEFSDGSEGIEFKRRFGMSVHF